LRFRTVRAGRHTEADVREALAGALDETLPAMEQVEARGQLLDRWLVNT
jgi:plasmid stability protein